MSCQSLKCSSRLENHSQTTKRKPDPSVQRTELWLSLKVSLPVYRRRSGSRAFSDGHKRLWKRCRLPSIPELIINTMPQKWTKGWSMTYFEKWRCFALESLAVHGLWSWSVGEIVGLLWNRWNVKYKQVSSPQKSKKEKVTYLAFANFLANNAFCPKPAAAPFVVIPGTILANINRSVSYTVFLWHYLKILDRHNYDSQGLCPYSPSAFSPHT